MPVPMIERQEANQSQDNQNVKHNIDKFCSTKII